MPFTRIAVKKGMPQETKKAIAHGVHQAMVDSIGILPICLPQTVTTDPYWQKTELEVIKLLARKLPVVKDGLWTNSDHSWQFS